MEGLGEVGMGLDGAVLDPVGGAVIAPGHQQDPRGASPRPVRPDEVPLPLKRALLEPVEHLLGDIMPAVVDRERVTAVGELPEVGDRG